MSDWMSSEELDDALKAAGSYNRDSASAAQRRITREYQRLTVRARETEGLRELLSEQAREFGGALGRMEMEATAQRTRADDLLNRVGHLEFDLDLARQALAAAQQSTEEVETDE